MLSSAVIPFTHHSNLRSHMIQMRHLQNGSTSIRLGPWVRTAPANLDGISRPSLSEPLNCSHWAWPVHVPLLCSQISHNLYFNRCCITVVGDVCACTYVHTRTFLQAGLYPPRIQGSSWLHLWLSHDPHQVLEHSRSSEIFVELIVLPSVFELRQSPTG